MDNAFKEEINSGDYRIYMDNILVATNRTFKHHIERVHHILNKIKDNDLQCLKKLVKCFEYFDCSSDTLWTREGRSM
jgi:hypothetical protein